MSIFRHLTEDITVQSFTDGAFGQPGTWADVGTNQGYIRPLSARERVSSEKLTQFATHRAVMLPTYPAAYGQRLKVGSAYYTVKEANVTPFSQGFQIVNCEVVT